MLGQRYLGVLSTVLTVLSTTCADDDQPKPSRAMPRGEDSAELCQDGLDNDLDELVDCSDLDCAWFCTLRRETDCQDQLDNDEDDAVDCADHDCLLDPNCGPERSDLACGDHLDNDGDGWLDCLDLDCRASLEVDYCGHEDMDDACRDRLDNDSDGLIDCLDAGCEQTRPCQPLELETTAARCRDDLDNDADGLTDCMDADCRIAEVAGCVAREGDELCHDGMDNDGDSLSDCSDPDCVRQTTCLPAVWENTAGLCQNGLDDDLDGLFDCADSDCWAAASFCGFELGSRCSDRLDNDGDRWLDCADEDCLTASACAPIPRELDLPACADHLDNDADNLSDCADPDCLLLPWCGPEKGEDACRDALDNDGNGLADCQDRPCLATLACTAGAVEEEAWSCVDAQDNDGDHLLDCADPDCLLVAMSPACALVEFTDSECADSFDNDGDGLQDCQDPDCVLGPICAAVRETDCGTGPCCANQLDDDEDGLADCLDRDCLWDLASVACDAPALAIHDLQNATDHDTFPLAWRGDDRDDPVRLRGVVVTHVAGLDLYLSDPYAWGPYHGLHAAFAASVSEPLAVQSGQVLDVAGMVTERAGETFLWIHAAVFSTAPLPTPEPFLVGLADLTAPLPLVEGGNDRIQQELDTGLWVDPEDDLATAERYEGMVVRLTNLVVVGFRRTGTGELLAYQTTGVPRSMSSPRLLVGLDYASPASELQIGQILTSITGLVSYERVPAGPGFLRDYRLLPRKSGDWVVRPFADADGDALSDADELRFGTDPLQADTDRDYYPDGEEAPDPLLVTSPANDHDGDGRLDALESFLLDQDGDGTPDQLDPEDFGSPHADRDQDGLPNADDPDDDNDGVCDPGVVPNTGGCFYVNGSTDNCPLAPEPLAAPRPDDALFPPHLQRNTDRTLGEDVDNPQLGDIYVEAFAHGRPGNACDWDADGDFWPGEFDNCPDQFNPDQDDADQDGVGDACPWESMPVVPFPCADPDMGGIRSCDLIFEEVLYNLSRTAPAGIMDANRDGRGHLYEDEFVELRNISGLTLDLSGLVLEDETTQGEDGFRHEFPPGSLLRRHQRLLVFGGGSPTRFPDWVVVQTASSGSLGLNNGGDTLSLMDPYRKTTLVELRYGTGTDLPALDRNVSLTRYPNGTNFWVPHPLCRDPVTGRVQAASPGRAAEQGRF